MRFFHILNELIKSRGIRQVEICEGTGVKEPWLSKLLKGSLFPSNWGMIHEIAMLLKLSDTEYNQLCNAYKAECLPSELIAAEQALYRLCSPDFESIGVNSVAASDTDPNLLTETVLHSHQILPAVQQMLINTKNVRILSSWEKPEPCEGLFNQIAACRDVRIEMLILLDDKVISADSLQVSAEILPLLFHVNGEVHTLHLQTAEYLNASPFPLMISTESIVLVLNAEGTEGMCFSGKAAEPYLRFFEKKYNTSAEGMTVYRNPDSFLLNWTDWLEPPSEGVDSSALYILCRGPSIFLSAGQQDVLAHIADEANKEMIAFAFNKMLQGLIVSSEPTVDFFWREGVSELLHAPEYFEYGRFLSKSIALNKRRGLLFQTLDDYRKNETNKMGLFLPPYPESKSFCINLWDNGRMLIVFDSDDGFCISVFRDTCIVNTILTWISALQKCGMIAGSEKALRYCEEELEKAMEDATIENE